MGTVPNRVTRSGRYTLMLGHTCYRGYVGISIVTMLFSSRTHAYNNRCGNWPRKRGHWLQHNEEDVHQERLDNPANYETRGHAITPSQLDYVLPET
jgi:hypothetical protein